MASPVCSGFPPKPNYFYILYHACDLEGMHGHEGKPLFYKIVLLRLNKPEQPPDGYMAKYHHKQIKTSIQWRSYTGRKAEQQQGVSDLQRRQSGPILHCACRVCRMNAFLSSGIFSLAPASIQALFA
jgi:hypothetical protein